MNRGIKVMLVIATVFVSVGILLSGLALYFGGFEMFKDFGTDFKSGAATFDEAEKIVVNVVSDDVKIERSDDDKIKVSYQYNEHKNYEFTETDGELKISFKDNRPWYNRIFSFLFRNTPVVVSLPDNEYTSLTISGVSSNIEVNSFSSHFKSTKLTTTSGNISAKGDLGALRTKSTSGSISIDSVEALNIEAFVTSGNVELSNVNARDVSVQETSGYIRVQDSEFRSFDSSSVSGRVKFYNVKCESSVNASTVSGDIILTALSSHDYNLYATSGRIAGTITDEKNFRTKTTSGKVVVPPSVSYENGTFTASTVSGDIIISIE